MSWLVSQSFQVLENASRTEIATVASFISGKERFVIIRGLDKVSAATYGVELLCRIKDHAESS